MNLLRIDSSVRVENSKTRMLTDFFINELKKKNSINIKHRDVGIKPPDMPTSAFILANYTSASERTPEMENTLRLSDELISELVESDAIVISSPMYNFTISTPLKTYIDNIVRVGETFTIDQSGEMRGLLTSKKALVITSRGAMSYKPEEKLHGLDFQENYLTTVFSFLGITNIKFTHTEAQDFGSDELKANNFMLSQNALSDLAKSW